MKMLIKGLSLALVAIHSMSLYAANNEATVLIDNKTNAIASYTHEHMTGTSSPLMSAVNPNSVAT
ncbi:hypothetical protein [Pseudomonas sp. NPDC089758]|uniref:hypothetical protein n=1 Tax=Pseudomonas sp. NPDC089758 TaxID=3364473 RepID=UPI00381D2B53